MADTLEEIYKATLNESGFNASGEATIITTDANTRYAIKDVQVKQLGGTNVSSNLLVNDVDVADVTSSVSGNEIIGTSSTVKLKTDTFPLTYQDVYFGFIPNASPDRIDKKKKAFVNNVEDTGLGFITAHNETPYGNINNSNYMAHYQVHNNVAVRIRHDGNSSTELHVYNSSGSQIFSETGVYSPKAFDQERYVYWLPSGSNFKQYDTLNNTTNNITYSLGSANVSSYSRLVYAGENWFWGVPQYSGTSAGNRAYIFNAATQTFTDASNSQGGNSTYGYSNDGMWAVYDGSVIHVIKVNNSNNWNTYTVNVGSGAVSNGPSFTSTNGPDMWTSTQWMDTFDRKLWYYNANGKLAYWDPTDGSFNQTTQSFSNNSPLGGNGHIFVGRETPSSSTVNSRTYTVAPSATYRITGVKSV